MLMRPRARNVALTAHVAASVGWLGAVVVFLALSVMGLRSTDPQTVRGAYLVMEPASRSVLVPLALISLLTGLVSSLGSPWGLVRHYWVLIKLAITVVSTIVLLAYLRTFGEMAKLAADPAVELDAIRNASPVLHSVLAVLALLTATALAIQKPRGTTGDGRRWQSPRSGGIEPSRDQEPVTMHPPRGIDPPGDLSAELRSAPRTGIGKGAATTRWTTVLGIIALLVVILFLAFHVAVGGPGSH